MTISATTEPRSTSTRWTPLTGSPPRISTATVWEASATSASYRVGEPAIACPPSSPLPAGRVASSARHFQRDERRDRDTAPGERGVVVGLQGHRDVVSPGGQRRHLGPRLVHPGHLLAVDVQVHVALAVDVVAGGVLGGQAEIGGHRVEAPSPGRVVHQLRGNRRVWPLGLPSRGAVVAHGVTAHLSGHDDGGGVDDFAVHGHRRMVVGRQLDPYLVLAGRQRADVVPFAVEPRHLLPVDVEVHVALAVDVGGGDVLGDDPEVGGHGPEVPALNRVLGDFDGDGRHRHSLGHFDGVAVVVMATVRRGRVATAAGHGREHDESQHRNPEMSTGGRHGILQVWARVRGSAGPHANDLGLDWGT